MPEKEPEQIEMLLEVPNEKAKKIIIKESPPEDEEVVLEE